MGQARELMNRATEALLARDFDALRDIYAPDVVCVTPDAGTLHGVDQFIEWNRSYLDALSDTAYEPTGSYETENCVIDQGDQIGTHTGTIRLPGGQMIPPTGRQLRVRSADIARVEGGRIVRHDFYFDQLELLSQLGLMEAPAATQP